MRTTSLIALLTIAVFVNACDLSARDQVTEWPPKPKVNVPSSPWAAQEFDKAGLPRKYSVVAYGYNYTDLYIDSFEVNGSGGGNLEVSIPTAGGGKHTCCTTITSGLPEGFEFTIKWSRDIYEKRWCTQIVRLAKPIPKEPRYLEVHFYQDGTIEIEATQSASPPRLKLERFGSSKRNAVNNINNDEKHSKCKDGYR